MIKLPKNLKQAAGLSAFFLVCIFAIWFLSSYSYLTVSSGDTQKKNIYITSGKYYKELELTNDSKTFLIKRGTYKIEASSGDKVSLYTRSFGWMKKNTLAVEVNDQKASSFIGSSPLPCAKSAADGSTVFYSCGSDTFGTIVNDKNTEGLEDSPFAGNTKAPDSIAVKEYQGTFLEAKVSGGNLTIRPKDDKGRYIEGQPGVAISGFGGIVSDAIFGASQDSENFAILDRSKRKLYNYKSLKDSAPVVHEIDQNKIDVQSYGVLVSSGKNYTYLINYSILFDEHEGGHSEDTGKSEYTASRIKPRILVYSHADGKQTAEHILSDTWQIRNFAEGPDNQLLFFLTGNLQNEVYSIKDKEPPERAAIPTNLPQEACWKDSDSFYYLSDTGTKIYLYSQSKQAAFLVYGNLIEGALINGLLCSGGKLTISLSSDHDGDTTSHNYYTLNDGAHSLKRIESLLPFYFDSATGTYKAIASKAGVKVVIPGGGESVLPAAREEIQRFLAEKLSARGIDAAKTNIVFEDN